MNEIINFGEKKRVKIIMLKGEKGDKGEDGSSGDYSELTNKPKINDVEINGNMTASDLGLVSETEFEQSQTVTDTSIDHIKESFATVEPSSESAHAYAVGQYLVYNGYLYKTLQAISIGDTLNDTAPSGNIALVTVADELNAIQSDVVDAQTDIGTLQTDITTAQGDIVQIYDDLSSKISSNAIPQMGFIRVNQVTGIHPKDGIVGTWAKIKNTNNVYIEYTVNYYQSTHGTTDSIRLDGFPQTIFTRYTSTVIRLVNGAMQMNASAGLLPSTNYPNNSSNSLSMLGFIGSSAGDCCKFSGIIYTN